MSRASRNQSKPKVLQSPQGPAKKAAPAAHGPSSQSLSPHSLLNLKNLIYSNINNYVAAKCVLAFSFLLHARRQMILDFFPSALPFFELLVRF